MYGPLIRLVTDTSGYTTCLAYGSSISPDTNTSVMAGGRVVILYYNCFFSSENGSQCMEMLYLCIIVSNKEGSKTKKHFGGNTQA